MKRCVAELRDGYVNICADRLEFNREENMVYVWDGNELVGAFDISVLLKIYISDRQEKA